MKERDVKNTSGMGSRADGYHTLVPGAQLLAADGAMPRLLALGKEGDMAVEGLQ